MSAGRWVTAGALAVAAVVAVGAMAVWRDRPVVAVALAAFALVLGWLSGVDIRERRLPNRVVGPLAAATVLWAVGYGVVDGDLGRAGVALVAGLVGSLALLALGLAGEVGMGDVKLAFPIGVVAGWLGLGAVEVTVVATALSSLVVALAVLATGRGRSYGLPYGVFLAVGSAAGILVAGQL